jgi:FMN-binding domain
VKRAPIVIAGTVAGLLGVLEFHTSPPKLTASSLPAPAASRPAGSGTAGRTALGSGGSTSSSSAGAASGPNSAGQRSAVGSGVNYYYGVVSVKVTLSGQKIVKVAIASLNDGSNPQSQFIDQQSIPILEQEVIKAQSASIQGVSGASYTSSGFDQSLQSALHKAGFS